MRGGRTVPETKQPYRQANNDFRSPPYDGGRGRTQKPGKPWTHGLCSCCDDCGERMYLTVLILFLFNF